MREHDALFIDGGWVRPSTSDVIEVVNPATEEVMGRVPDGSAADVDRAVAAARAAFDGWAAVSVEDRAKFLQGMHDAIVSRLTDIGLMVSEEIGSPLPFATLVQVAGPLMVLGAFPASPGRSRSRRRWACRSSSGSRSAWWAPSRRGTTPCS